MSQGWSSFRLFCVWNTFVTEIRHLSLFPQRPDVSHCFSERCLYPWKMNTRQLSCGNRDSFNPEAKTGPVAGIAGHPGLMKSRWNPSVEALRIKDVSTLGRWILSSTPFLQPTLSGKFSESLSFSTAGDQTNAFVQVQLVLCGGATPESQKSVFYEIISRSHWGVGGLSPFSSLRKCGFPSIFPSFQPSLR